MLRVVYHRQDDLRTDATQQLARGGLLVRVEPPPTLTLHDAVDLRLVLPDGTELRADANVLQILPGHGVAVATPPALVEEIRRKVAWRVDASPDAGPPEHSVVDVEVMPEFAPEAVPEAAAETVPAAMPEVTRAPTRVAPASSVDGPPRSLDEMTNAEKMHMALHGTRDERNAILRDRNRALHPFVLKNPQLSIDDVSTMAKNAQLSPDLLKLIADRKEWMQRPAIALALAKNPKTPPDAAIRALDHVSIDSLRMIAKGIGALPHVVAAARKKVVG